MANSSSAHGAKLSSAKFVRRPRRRPRYLSKMAMYTAVGVAFVAVAGMLVLLSRGGAHDTSGATPLSGAAPDFTLPSVNGQPVTLSSYKGQRNVLLFFNEGYGCAPCWQQAQDIQKRSADLQAANTEFLDIMVDPTSLIKNEVSRWGLKMPVLSDTNRAVSRQYNTLGFGMHADKPNHTFVFIDKDGEIRWWQDYASMRAPTDEVVQKVQALTAGQ
jgi:peroxiredoxin